MVSSRRPITTRLTLCASTCVLLRRALPPPTRSLTSSLATKADVETHFASHGTGDITEIKLMNGFGFIEYKDAMDARDVVPGKQATSSAPGTHTLAFALTSFRPLPCTLSLLGNLLTIMSVAAFRTSRPAPWTPAATTTVIHPA